jgi:hypothetical protein
MGACLETVKFKDIEIRCYDRVSYQLYIENKFIFREENGLLESLLYFKDLEDFKSNIENIIKSFIANMVFI